MGSVLIFDIKGSFGFFKTAEVTRATLSFPFTRTSIIGIIAAILGEERNSYWEENHPLANAEIAIQLLTTSQRNSFQHSPLTVNYVHTKYPINIGGSSGTIKTYLSNAKKRGFVTDVRLDMIRNIHYRIFFKKFEKSEYLAFYDKLKKYLEKNWAYYPPYLGHANLLAEIDFIGEYYLEELKDKEASISTVVPSSIIAEEFKDFIHRKISVYSDIPISMDIKNNKVLNVLTENFIVPSEETGKVDLLIKPEYEIYEVDFKDERTSTNISDKVNIVFIPPIIKAGVEQITKIINKQEEIDK